MKIVPDRDVLLVEIRPSFLITTRIETATKIIFEASIEIRCEAAVQHCQRSLGRPRARRQGWDPLLGDRRYLG